MRQLRRLTELQRFSIHATDGEIGSQEELYFDDQSWSVRYLTVNTGSRLVGRRVLIAPVAVGELDDSGLVLRLTLTRDQVKNSPPIDTEKPVSRQYEAEYYKYYGWMPYWEVGLFPGPVIPPPAPFKEVSAEEAEDKNPHLRSTAEVTGYHIEASDGEIGHVEDFVIDDQDWVIHYIEVDTRNWWPGKKVLVSPTWIMRISWSDRRVFIDLPREVIRSAPAYDPSKFISRDYEVQLYKYYSQPQNKGGVSS